MGVEVIGSDGRIKDRTGIAPQGGVFSAVKSVNQSIPNTTWTKVVWDSNVEFDPFTWFDRTNNRFQPKVPGYFYISAGNRWSNAGGMVWIDIRKNGISPGKYIGVTNNNATSTDITPSGSYPIYLNGSTDYIEVWAYQNSGAALNILNGGWFTGTLVGVSVGVVPEPWHKIGAAGEPVFKNAWVNYGDGRDARFYKDPNGVVYLAGLIKSGTLTTAAFTLPVGYRILSGASGTSSNLNFAVVSNSTFGQVSVADNGDVIPQTNASNLWLDLSSISFRAEQ